MQKTFLLLALAAILASCQGNTDKTNAGPEAATGDMAVQRDENQGGVPDSILITMEHANNQITRYHKYVHLGDGDSTTKTAFMLDAVSLKNYLNNNPDIVKLNVYLAQTGNPREMNLVYIGAVDSAGMYVERAYTKHPGDTQQYMLNHSFPCPTCDDRIKLHTPPSGD